jgi:hypothetical protein
VGIEFHAVQAARAPLLKKVYTCARYRQDRPAAGKAPAFEVSAGGTEWTKGLHRDVVRDV